MSDLEKDFADVLRSYWSFDEGQQHTHSWHDRENFIKKVLPGLLRDYARHPANQEGWCT